jgi:ClpP class serine protease
MSGGTLICLAANEIVMSPHAVLGPIDPQLGQFPAASLLKVVEQKPIAEIDDQTLVFADIGRKAIGQVRTAARELLEGRLPREKAEELAQKLSEGTWTHDYPIFAAEATDMGLNVSTDIPADILDFLSLYPQPTRTQGGVEYLPIQRQRQAPGRAQLHG